jgi:hypothetical protein
MKKKLLLGSALIGFSLFAYADEGMWTLNNLPKEALVKKYKFTPEEKWVQHVQLSSARLAGGCSGSFVSANGLVMTNHHCVHDCVADLSTKDKDFVASGFYAKTEAEEVKCPGVEVNKLIEITDVTERINKTTAGLSDQKFNDAQKAEISKIEKECSKGDAKLRCDVVRLYQGGVFNLYKYQRFQDLRLVFAPEISIAFFGGDPDNFNFPRYNLDSAFIRVYEDNKPVKMDHFFSWSKAGAIEGELTFVAGNPGRTERLLTISQLEAQRDITQPATLLRLAEYRGLLTEFMARGPEQRRIAEDTLFGIENSFKAIKGRQQTLVAEKDFREKINANPEKQKLYAAAWDNIAKALEEQKKLRLDLSYMEQGSGFNSTLFGLAKTLTRAADEVTKPNEKRLPEFAEARIPGVTLRLFSEAPIYDEMEILDLTFSLTKLREDMGADNPFVKKVLGKESPAELAKRLITKTSLKDLATRKKLWEGGKKAVDEAAKADPLLQLVRLIDEDGRKVRKTYEDTIDSAIKKNSELIAKARFEVYGTNTYPDATFTLRLSYGQVKGYEENGKKVAPFTNIGGTFDRHTGSDPFKLPESWLSNKTKLNGKVPFNFVTTNDIIGGNSGSPVINRNAEIVGLVFDGNIQSLGGAYGFDESVNRTVAVHSEAIIEALTKVYNATRIVDELRPKK